MRLFSHPGPVHLVLFAAFTAAFLAPPAHAGDPCAGTGGATLESAPLLLAPGGTLEIVVRSGIPLAPISIGADMGPGPVTVPGIGTFCLDGSSRLRLLARGLADGSTLTDENGELRLTLPIALAARRFAGRTAWIQAAILDPLAPKGHTITNALSLPVLSAVVESFTNPRFRDDTETTADWDRTGVARGSVGAPRTVDFEPPLTGFTLADPLRPEGSRLQLFFGRNEIAIEEGDSILSMSWGPQSNFVFATTYSDLEVKIGTTARDRLVSGYDANYTASAGNPTTVFQGNYVLPGSPNTSWEPWPTFTTPFEYTGQGNLVFEVSTPPGAAEYQLFRNSSFAMHPRYRNVGPFGSETAESGERTRYHTRFEIARTTTFATSLFYDTGIDDPDYAPPQVLADSLPPGTRVDIELEGADDTDGDGIPDDATRTGLVSDANDLDGKRYVRFRLALVGDATAGEAPVVTRVVIPFSP